MQKRKAEAMWQIINKGMGKIQQNEQNIELKYWLRKITDSQDVAEFFNSYFSEVTDKLKKNYDRNYSCKMPWQKN
jgi:hypothetical protein